ncbi:hypothetical protein A9Z42_0081880 [Trichoderma parareesei]|uniref:Uncharacterized protein n=1 Tax=Trichoderma parareesei TaxID=858221 RepID=A0A2H3A5R9_TRIPA|nr:hypothetical protein A9Z42_0081880 [Trichoderma parareesei]
MADLWFYDNTGDVDDDDVYRDSCPDLNLLPASAPVIDTDLYINQNAPATQAQGSTKSHQTPVPGGIALLDSGDRSDHHFSVERLAWVDGWQETTEVKGKLMHKQPMTLVVLKFDLQTFDPDVRVETVKATLQFKDTDQQRGDDPEVQAWAPFHEWEDWNATNVQEKATTSVNATASGGYAGASLSLGWGKGRDISWDRTAFDEGRSILVKSRRRQRPIGVTWFLQQNKLQNLGVPPQFWVAVLIKRSTNLQPYLAKFRLDVRTGTLRDQKRIGLEFLRIKPGDTSAFTATPNPGVWDEMNCHGEGEDIRDSGRVDLNNLGQLLANDRTALAGTWGPQYRRSAPGGKEANGHEVAATAGLPPDATLAAAPSTGAAENPVPPEAEAEAAAQREEARDADKPSVSVPEARQPAPLIIAPGQQPPRTGPAYDLLMPPQTAVGAGTLPSPDLEADVTGSAGTGTWRRLVALEARAAQAEARLAAQDQLILRLQQAVDVRDAQLARMEQAMRVAAAALSLG